MAMYLYELYPHVTAKRLIGNVVRYIDNQINDFAETIILIILCYIVDALLQIRRPGFDSRHYQGKKRSGSGTGSTQPREYN
jgi:hypothetical protein